MIRNGMRPIHPGEILREEYLEPLDMSVNALSNALHVPATRMNEIVRENRGGSADTALRLARYFGTSERFWRNYKPSMSCVKHRSARLFRLRKRFVLTRPDCLVCPVPM
mgnify:CR=1 FL=1